MLLDYLKTKNGKITFIVTIFIIALLALVGRALVPKNDIDKIPGEGTSKNYYAEANIVGGEALFKMLEGGARYDSFAKDLFIFAKTEYPVYLKQKQVVGFEITSKLQKSGSDISFDGSYGSVKHKISIKLSLLNNQRLSTSITDTKTKKSINETLPSNSKRNKFVVTLPIQTKDYDIGFDPVSDQIVVTLYERSRALQDKATEVIKQAIGETALKNESIQYALPELDINNSTTIVPGE